MKALFTATNVRKLERPDERGEDLPKVQYGVEVELTAKHDPDTYTPNKEFWDKTPTGSVYLRIDSASGYGSFEKGMDYWVSFEHVKGK
jgi:hypothetical protein